MSQYIWPPPNPTVEVGRSARALKGAIAIGHNAHAENGAVAIGEGVVAKEGSVVILNVNVTELSEHVTELSERVERLETIVTEQRKIIQDMWYAPGMPGYMEAKASNAQGILRIGKQ